MHLFLFDCQTHQVAQNCFKIEEVMFEEECSVSQEKRDGDMINTSHR